MVFHTAVGLPPDVSLAHLIRRSSSFFLRRMPSLRRLTNHRDRQPMRRRLGLILSLALICACGALPQGAKAVPVTMDLNRALQIGWYSLRVQNPFGTNYTGLTAIKSYDQAKKEFVFLSQKGEDVVIKEEDISFIYFRQLPDRADVNVQTRGPIRNLQITPYKEFLYDIKPGRLVIRDGVLMIDSRWRIGEQTPFDVNLTPPAEQQGQGSERLEIPRRIQLNYLGNHYLVETELVNIVTHDAPLPGAGTVPRPIPNPFKNSPPSPAPAP
jgi:hypothetical protein